MVFRALPGCEADSALNVDLLIPRTLMKHLIIALSFALAAGATFASPTRSAAPAASGAQPAAAAATAVATTQPGTPQRSKMKACNADAKVKDIHGPDRRAFMKQCLSGKAKPAAAS
jgi:hypothetical protein